MNAEIGAVVGSGNLSNRNQFGNAANPLGAHTYNYCNVATYQNNGGNIPTVYNRASDPWQNFTNANSDVSVANPLGDAQWSIYNDQSSTDAFEECLDPDYNGMAEGGGSNNGAWVDVIKALDLTEYDAYESQIKWQEKKDLYKRLDKNIAYRQSMSTFQNFYDEYSGSNGEKLYTFEKKMEELNDTLVYNDTTIRYQKLMEAQQKLLEVSASQNYESNDKFVKLLLLTTELKGIDSITETEWQTVEHLASSCPLAEGGAVYTARALYTYRDHTVYWDDVELCATVSFFKTEEQNETIQKSEFAKLYYDRGGNSAVINYMFYNGSAGMITLYDLYGREISYAVLQANSKLAVIPLPEIAAGEYIYRITAQYGFATTGKFAVIR